MYLFLTRHWPYRFNKRKWSYYCLSDLFDLVSVLYSYRFSRFDMFVHYFVKLRTNHYTLLTVSLISFIFDSASNLHYRPLWRYVKVPIVWREWQNATLEKWLARWFTKCHLYTSHFSHFANIFSRSRQFDDKCIALHQWPYMTVAQNSSYFLYPVPLITLTDQSY